MATTPVRFGVYSGDPLAVERTVAQRLQALGAVERIALFGDDVPVGQVLSELGTENLFQQDKALVVRRADALLAKEQLADALEDGPPPHCAVFFLGERQRGRLPRLAQEAKHFPLPRGRALRALAADLLEEAGLPAPRFLVDMLAEAAGGDTLHLAREVEKLVLWEGERLARFQVPRLLFFAEPRPYAFLDAVGERDLATALAELGRLLSSGWDPFRLFFVLAAHLRALLTTLAAVADGRTPPGPGWLARRRLHQAQRYSAAELVGLLARLQQLDMLIKTGRCAPRDALFQFILGLEP
ncbi:MAG: DNA polymerase III subunit delta [Candidatus Bipolaricaulaceae bacterium]